MESAIPVNICPQCKKREVVPGRKRCKECQEYNRNYQREYHELTMKRSLAKGLCTRCNKNPVVPGHKRCRECMDYAKNMQRKYGNRTYQRKKKRIEEGLCKTCGKSAVPGKKQCEACLIRNRAYVKKYNQQAIEQGICPHCRRNPPAPNRKWCEECLAKAKLYQQKKKARNANFFYEPKGGDIEWNPPTIPNP